MSGGGGKGSKQTTEIDPRLADASVEALKKVEEANKIPYIPNRGVQFAAFTPQQNAAFAGAREGASAYGLDPGTAPVMPQVQNAGGIAGYSSGAVYDDTMKKSIGPGLLSKINEGFYKNDIKSPAAKGGIPVVSKKPKPKPNDKKPSTKPRGTVREAPGQNK